MDCAIFHKITDHGSQHIRPVLPACWNSSSSEFSDAPGCLSIKSNINFPAASMASDLMGLLMLSVPRHHTIVYKTLALLARVSSRDGGQTTQISR